MTMKKLTILTAALLAAACSKNEDVLLQYNEAPAIVFTDTENYLSGITVSGGNTLTAKVKASRFVPIKIACSDKDGHLGLLRFSIAPGNAVFTRGDYLYRDADTLTVRDNALTDKFGIKALKAGKYAMTISAVDGFGVRSDLRLSVTAVENSAPVPVFSTSFVQNLLKIDASASYDPDTDLGDGIVSYEYRIDGKQTYRMEESVCYVALPPGEHVIKVAVFDQEGLSDESEADIITVPDTINTELP